MQQTCVEGEKNATKLLNSFVFLILRSPESSEVKKAENKKPRRDVRSHGEHVGVVQIVNV